MLRREVCRAGLVAAVKVQNADIGGVCEDEIGELAAASLPEFDEPTGLAVRSNAEDSHRVPLRMCSRERVEVTVRLRSPLKPALAGVAKHRKQILPFTLVAHVNVEGVIAIEE